MSDPSEVPDPHHLGLFAALCAPFHPQEVRQRSQGGRDLFYITARVAMNRLDDVVGPSGWWDEYVPGEHSVLCKLTIRLPDGSTLTKQDAGGYAGMPDQGDDDKSGYSDAFKRACVKMGIGRYLYRDGVPRFAASAEPESAHAPDPAPQRSQQAPRRDQAPPPRDHAHGQPAAGGNGQRRDYGDKPPTSGRGLFAWTKEQEQKYEVGLLKYLNNWAKLQEFPGRMVDWDADQVARAHQEAARKLASIASPPAGPGDRGDAFEGQGDDEIPF